MCPILTLGLKTIDVQNVRRIGAAVRTELPLEWYAPLSSPNLVCPILTLGLRTIDVQNFRKIGRTVQRELRGDGTLLFPIQN